MAKSLVFANGEMQVSLDNQGLVRYISFPYIGYESHLGNQVHKIGVWIDGDIAWLDDGSWTHKARFLHGVGVGHTVVTNDSLGVLLEFEDFVASDSNVFVRNVHIVNLRDTQRNIRLFMHQAFDIGQNKLADSARHIPDAKAILHYCGRRSLLVSGQTDVGQSYDQLSVGLYGGGLDGTWRDAEDGQLSGSLSSSGQTDSVIGFSLTIGAMSSRRVHYWLIASNSQAQAITLQDKLQKSGLVDLADSAIKSWRKWLAPSHRALDRLEAKYRQPATEMLIRLRSQIDRRGAVAMSSNATIQKVIPHQSAYVVWPLLRLGYIDEVKLFLSFCRHNLSSKGYLADGYLPDGGESENSLPFSEDKPPAHSKQTAMVLFLIGQLASSNGKNKNASLEHYTGLVLPMANFLADFVGDDKLPKPSFREGALLRESDTYTVALTYASLQVAADIADFHKDQNSVVKWRTAADDMFRAANETLLDSEVIHSSAEDSSASIDSLFGSFMFGLIDARSDIATATARDIELRLRTPDGLFMVSKESSQVDWIGSLRMAQYYNEIDRHEDVNKIVAQAVSLISKNHLPDSDSTWIMAEIVSLLLDTISK